MREMGIGEYYERNITPIRSDISRFSGGTVGGLGVFRLIFGGLMEL